MDFRAIFATSIRAESRYEAVNEANELRAVIDPIYDVKLLAVVEAGEIAQPLHAWMIECRHERTGQPSWWSGGEEFSEEANRAIRFARQADAELVVAGFGWRRDKYVATEHCWL